MTESNDAPFKLAIRAEGNFVNCYLAPAGDAPPTLQRHLLGTMNRRVMEADPALFVEWKELMKRVLVIAVKEALNIDLDIEKMREEDGPENERTPGGSGH